jgi:16S rRNA (guanine(966)-N(2))-methyltransferase RsmD
MRVISGDLGGRKLLTLEGTHTRPPLEAIRQATFNILANDIKGAKVLDLFAGSGSVGIEALSRGATSVDFVESFRPALKVLKQNLDDLNLSQHCRVFSGKLPQALKQNDISKSRYDLVFLDPPFDAIMRGEFLNLEHQLLDQLHPNSTVVVRYPERFPLTGEDPYFETFKERRYGISVLLFRQLKASNATS